MKDSATPPAPVRGLLTQSFFTSLPIVLTIGLGFAANYYQSRQQHFAELERLGVQTSSENKKQQSIVREAERQRRFEAQRAFDLQQREFAAKLEQQKLEFAENLRLTGFRFSQEQTTQRIQHAAQQAQQSREFDRSLERQRRQNEADLLLQVIKVGDLEVARSNINFLLEAGLVRDADEKISAAARRATPVLPTSSGEFRAVGFEETGALPLLSSGERERSAGRLLACAIDEYNKNVRENGGEEQIKKYLVTLGFTSDVSIPWSGAFIGFCLKVAGAERQIVPSASNSTMMSAAQKSGIWLPKSEQTILKPGDVYFLSRQRGMHIGIVRSTQGDEFEGIEGNSGDRISLVRRSTAAASLAGFARLRD